MNVSVDAPTTVTVTAHRASPPPAGQLLPGVADTTVPVRDWLPVSGLFTVTEYVIVAESPGARFPVQVRFGAAYDTDPAVAAASPL